MRSIALALVLMTTAAFLPRSSRFSDDIWDPLVVKVAFLGNRFAAADAFWLRVLQELGSEQAAAARYPGVEQWLDGLTRLDPAFGNAYFVASVYLVADPARADAIDALMARGEAALPDDYRLPFSRGFLAYFGGGDAATAAGHYERAARLPGVPPYVASFAARLKTESADCDTAGAHYREMIASSDLHTRDRLRQESLRIAIACEERVLESATAAFRLRTGRNPENLDELNAAGVLKRPPLAEAGMCWSTDEFGNAHYDPCR